MIKLLIIAATAFGVAAISGLFIIPFLHKLKFGQEIREEGPAWHKSKSGTPTMGGFIFIVAIIIASVIGLFLTGLNSHKSGTLGLTSILFTALGFGSVGFLDDYIKVILKRNLGLKAGQKFALQFLIALISSVWMVTNGVTETAIKIPFSDMYLNLTYLGYIPFVIVVMLAGVNSVNLTDGLDGLAASVTLFIALFYCVVSSIEGATAAAVFAAALVGGVLGFLIYNSHPAKVFMGDTGSLFLGGAVSALAIYLKNPAALLIVGFVYVAEALSVIIQVAYFKKFGKRIFKMSPIHHHFEMCGWSEKKIVTVFSVCTICLCIIGYWA